jgi:serine/threonine protein kinase
LGPSDDPEYGRHGDIKPQNILWFATQGNDRDLLVVSDLGLTRYHSQLTKSHVYGVDGLTWAYRPPEIDLRQRIAPSYDIWSLGCVFLEFVIWYLEGFDAVEQFGLDRAEDDVSQVRGLSEDKYFNIITKPGQASDGSTGHAVVKPVVQRVG